MKQETYDILMRELNKNKYSTEPPYNVEKLFKIFAEQEITTFEQTTNYLLAQEFKDFVAENINSFRGITNNGNPLDNSTISELRGRAYKISYPLAMFKYKFYVKGQESFVKDVENIVGSDKKEILEIGSGQIPFSSFLLAKDNIGNIHTMDKFIISSNTIRNLGCTPHNEYFNNDTEIKFYDFIVANKACSAIEPIVKDCVAKKKPYFMKLCSCEAPGGTIDGWKEYLKHIDENIKFAEKDYAYDLDL